MEKGWGAGLKSVAKKHTKYKVPAQKPLGEHLELPFLIIVANEIWGAL